MYVRYITLQGEAQEGDERLRVPGASTDVTYPLRERARVERGEQ